MTEVPITILHDPGGTRQFGHHLYALIVEHGENDEALAGIPSPFGGVMPAVVLSEATADKLRAWAADVAKISGKPVRLIRYDRADVLEVFRP